MSFIQFESGREKDKARQELREARAQLLQQAKELADQRSRREVRQELRGESNWMLPAVANKLKKVHKSTSGKSKSTKTSHKSKEKLKKHKTKKKHKKHHSSSSDESDTDTDSSTTSTSSPSSSSEDERQRRRHKKKSKKKSKSQVEWVESAPAPSSSTESVPPPQRDSWMTTEALMLKTFSRDRKEPSKPNEKQQQIDAYDPSKSKYELNPYWKSNGTGLPGFQKPKTDDDPYDQEADRARHAPQKAGTRNWRKQTTTTTTTKAKSPSPSSTSAESGSEAESAEQTPKHLTDEQINDLAAKAIKAELKGNVQLASELNQQLASARKMRAELLANGQLPRASSARPKAAPATQHVLLTRTDQSGNVRPLVQSRAEPKGARSSKRKAETHVDGQRVRYFADDDRYDIKQMFEREKHATAADANLQFADIVAKHKNPNDDLEDIFADKVRRNVSQANADKREMQSAIREHQKLAATLESCERCFDSVKLDKQLLVSMGQQIYLALPWHVGLQNGHCILTSMQHVACCTQLDEDAWEELGNFRKALTRMFAAQRKDVVFYEIANKLHRRPHFSVHCIPIPDSHAEMAPFYFKKAIEESEQEWCINKQLVSLRQKSLRAAIPKGLPYLWVHFGMDSGFAHVIEDELRFPANFAQEIIGGMLELNPNTWRKPWKEQNSIGKVKTFAEWWKKYDCTEH